VDKIVLVKDSDHMGSMLGKYITGGIPLTKDMTSDVGHKKYSAVYNITEFCASCATQSVVLLFFHTKRADPRGRTV
jgi:hypothetical protein